MSKHIPFSIDQEYSEVDSSLRRKAGERGEAEVEGLWRAIAAGILEAENDAKLFQLGREHVARDYPEKMDLTERQVAGVVSRGA